MAMQALRLSHLISVAATALSLLSIGCATQYQSSGPTGGYSSTRLDENVFHVEFRGNGYTDMQRAVDFTLLRSAEIALVNGYSYFTVIDRSQSIRNSTVETPTRTTGTITRVGNTAYGSFTTSGGNSYEISKPTTNQTIVCFKEKPEGFSYNALYIHQSIRAKYGLQNSTTSVTTPAPARGSSVSPLPPARAPQQKSIPDRLRELKELKELGILTTEEYDSRRKALLDKL